MSFFGASSSGQPNNNATTSSAPAGGGLFGSTTTPTAQSSNLFGNQPKSTTSSFSFGSPSTGGNNATAASPSTIGGSVFGGAAAKPAEQKPLFGAVSNPASNAAPGTTTPSSAGGTGGGLFGGSSTTPSTTGLFGSKPSAAPTGTAPSLFGNSSSTPTATTTSTTPATAASASNLFGQSNPSISQGAPASKPGGLFGPGGAGTTGTSLFSGTSSTTTPPKPPFALNSTTPSGAPPSSATKPPGGGSLFAGASTQNSPALFSPPLGEKKEAQTTGLFGSQANAQVKPATTQAATSLFPGTSQTQKPGASLFGAAKPAGPSASETKPANIESLGSTGASSGPSLFGQQAQSKPTETAPASKSASLFGNATAAPKPAGSSPFLNATSTAQTSSTAAPAAAPASSLFGGASKPATGATTTESSKSLFGKPAMTTSAPSEAPKATNLFGVAPTSAAAPSTATTAAPTSGTTSAAAANATTAPATATTTTAPSSSSLFGGLAKPTPPGDSTAPKPAAAQTTGLGASSSGPTSSMARLKNRTMDEILNRWATDLSKYQKEFKEQASQVAAWDRLLVENGDKIQKLYLDTFEAEKASREVERHLVTVESQQEELESWLNKYEEEVDQLFSNQIGTGDQLAGPDQERERTYKLAEKITERLDDMGRDLTKMIKEINDISGTVSKGSKPDDPLSQIVRVLNGHLTQLQWIDTNAAALQAKVTAAQKASSQIGSHYGGAEQDNADSFYRSYMGRR